LCDRTSLIGSDKITKNYGCFGKAVEEMLKKSPSIAAWAF